DPAIGAELQTAFEAEDITVLTQTEVDRVDYSGDRFILSTAGEAVTADRLLIATGRTPNTAELNLAAVGVDTDQAGAIHVNEQLQTSNARIDAVGDCADLPQLVYVAAAAGTRAAVNMSGGTAALDLSVVPTVLFTDPQVATVGLDEYQAHRAGIATDSRRLELSAVPRALAN